MIAEVAGAAVADTDAANVTNNGHSVSEQQDQLTCTIKALPPRLLVSAAETAQRINPINAPSFGPFAAANSEFDVSDPLAIAVLTSKYWGPRPRRLTVSFLEPAPLTLRDRILSHMNAWNRTAGISFAATNGIGDVRISRGSGGYWSYLGTDIFHIPKNRPTMNLQNFSMSTPESEYRRVVRHETGHTLGFPHEHMRRALVARIDPAKAYDWFLRTYGWNKATVDAQVLTPLNELSLMATPPDQTSIMCYQLPGSITKDGRPIIGGMDINVTDFAFAGRIYLKTGHALDDGVQPDGAMGEEPAQHDVATSDWPESEDVPLEEVSSAEVAAVV